MDIDHVIAYPSCSPEYADDYSLFLSRTNQKVKLINFLENMLAERPPQGLLIDVGAGDGILSVSLQEFFAKIVCIEPNPKLAFQIHERIPSVEVIMDKIENISKLLQADLVLCSAVFFHIPHSSWLSTYQRMCSWLVPGGRLVLALHAPKTGFREMLRNWGVELPSLSATLLPALALENKRSSTRVLTIPATVSARNLAEATAISRFMLNEAGSLPKIDVAELEQYLRLSCRHPDGSYLISCDQEVLVDEA